MNYVSSIKKIVHVVCLKLVKPNVLHKFHEINIINQLKFLNDTKRSKRY